MDLRIKDVLVSSVLIPVTHFIGEYCRPEAENAVRDQKIRAVITGAQKIILQSSDTVRDLNDMPYPARYFQDHVLGLTCDKAARGGKIGIILVDIESRDIHHAERFIADLTDVRSDVHRLDEWILLISETKDPLLSECGISDRLNGIRHIGGRKTLALEERHIFDTLQGSVFYLVHQVQLLYLFWL